MYASYLLRWYLSVYLIFYCIYSLLTPLFLSNFFIFLSVFLPYSYKLLFSPYQLCLVLICLPICLLYSSSASSFFLIFHYLLSPYTCSHYFLPRLISFTTHLYQLFNTNHLHICLTPTATHPSNTYSLPLHLLHTCSKVITITTHLSSPTPSRLSNT